MSQQSKDGNAEATRSGESFPTRWNLSDILPANSGRIFQTTVLDRLEAMVVEFENSRPELTDSIGTDRFFELLQNFERIVRLRARLSSYSYMRFSEDTRSQDARTFKARAEEIDADAANRTLFFELWWKALPDMATRRLIEASKDFHYYLRRLIETKQYTLPEQVEQAINLKDVTGRSALLQIYHQVRDSFSYELKIEGEPKKFTEEQLRDLFYSPRAEERSSAYSAMLSRFEQNKDLLGEIYKMLVRDWANEGLKLRKYSSPISIRNVSNDVPDEAVGTLLQSCRRNAPLFHRYFKFKAKTLGIDRLSRTDVYAPLGLEAQKTYSWGEATSLVLDTFESFDSSFSSLAHNLLSQSHIDSEPREGKIGGAYCQSVTPDITPYVLLSFTGKTRTVSTLAHELGHAIHAQLAARKNDNELVYDAPLPLAETASVFGELLLANRMLSDADQSTRKRILVDLVDDSYATILRQSFFVLFELEAHEKIARGINVDEINEIYLSNLAEQFGSSVSLPSEFKYEWLSIPHIYQSPFYCYSYAWGNLLVFALYAQYRKEGRETFAPRYIRLLEYGGSESPELILKDTGFDVRSGEFWDSGFEELSRTIAELEKS